MKQCLSSLLLCAVVSGPALAQQTEPALCTDRPTKATASCTVPAGKVQIESDFGNWTVNRNDGTRTTVLLPFNPTVKIGLSGRSDVQVNVAPYQRVENRNKFGVVTRADGVGDVVVRYKHRVTGADAGWQFAIAPFVKLPTAPAALGNRKWEGGVVVAAQKSLGSGFSLTLAPEVDWLANSSGSGRHVQVAGALNIGKALGPRLTAYAEYWTAHNFDPAATVRQHSADFALAWLASPRVQIDAGVNVGLNRATPDAQLYLGLSTRF